MGFRPTNGHESPQSHVMLSEAKHLLFFTFRSRFFVASLLRMTGLG
jgi:hypothetical protein